VSGSAGRGPRSYLVAAVAAVVLIAVVRTLLAVAS
jgi:hypothetical protein